MKPRFPILTGGAVCFALAAVAGWNLTGSELVAEVRIAPVSVRSTDRPKRESSHGLPDAVRREMDRLRGISAPADRLRATLELAGRIPLAEIRGWIEGRWFSVGDGFDAQLFRQILLNRWLAGDPDSALLWAADQRESKDAVEIRDLMAATDPRRLLAFFHDHPNPAAQGRLLAQLAKKNPALALESLATMIDPDGHQGTGSVTDFNLKYAFKDLAAALPTELKAALAGISPDMAARAQGALFTRGLEISFDATLAELAARADGCAIFLGSFSEIEGLNEKVLDNLASMPHAWRSELARKAGALIEPDSAGRWLDTDLAAAGFSPTEIQSLQARALSFFAGSEPDRAIKLFSTSDLGPRRLGMMDGFFRNLNNADPAKAAGLLATLTSESEIEEASRFMKRGPYLPADASTANPDEWLKKVLTTDQAEQISGALVQLTRDWDMAEKTELANRFRTLPDEEKRRAAAVLAVSSSLGNDLRADALGCLLAQPQAAADPFAPVGGLALKASTFAVKWSAADPAAAAAWVSGLSENDNGFWVRKNLARNWSLYDPAAAAIWVNALPAALQTGVRDFMKSGSP